MRAVVLCNVLEACMQGDRPVRMVISAVVMPVAMHATMMKSMKAPSHHQGVLIRA